MKLFAMNKSLFLSEIQDDIEKLKKENKESMKIKISKESTEKAIEIKNPEESMKIKIPEESTKKAAEIKNPEESTEKAIELKRSEESIKIKNPKKMKIQQIGLIKMSLRNY